MSKMVDLEKLKEWKQLKERIEQLEEEMGKLTVDINFII